MRKQKVTTSSLAALEAIQRQLDFLTEQNKARDERDKARDERLGEVEKQNDDMVSFLSESKAQF